MGTEAPAAAAAKKQASSPLPLPPPPPVALFLVRARSRVADLHGAAARSGPPDTPPRRSPLTVPFLWEEAPGKPKAPPLPAQGDAAPPAHAGSAVPSDTAAAATTPAAGAGDHAKEAPLKLPPRLQRVGSATDQRDASLSPKAVLHHGPYNYGCAGGAKRPPRRTASGGLAAFRRTPSASVGRFFSRNKTSSPAAAGTDKNRGAGHHGHLSTAAAPDAPWCSPAASSASSSSSLSTSCFGDDYGRGGHRRPADVRGGGSSEEDECAGGSVRITRFRRNRSLPSITTSHLWASFRKSVKQISPWS